MNVREGRIMKQTGWAIAALFGVSLMGAPGVCAAGHATNRTSPPAQSTTEIACCVPDDEGVECETGTADECAAAQGVNLGAVACDPNPCPPPAPEIACCVPDDDEVECEEETADECTADGGTSLGAGTCDPNPCPAPPVDRSGRRPGASCRPRQGAGPPTPACRSPGSRAPARCGRGRPSRCFAWRRRTSRCRPATTSCRCRWSTAAARRRRR